MSHRNTRQPFIMVALLALSALLLVGCNTMEGLGKDIQSAGRVLEQTADRDN